MVVPFRFSGYVFFFLLVVLFVVVVVVPVGIAWVVLVAPVPGTRFAYFVG